MRKIRNIAVVLLVSLLLFSCASVPSESLYKTFVKAIRETDEATVELCLKDGVYINLADKKGITPLQIAWEVGDEGIIQRLIDGGAKDMTGDIIFALLPVNEPMALQLMENGSKGNRDALLWAIEKGRADLMIRLCELGAPVDIDTLATAIIKDNDDAAGEALVKAAGYEVFESYRSDKSIYSLALDFERESYISALLDAGVHISREELLRTIEGTSDRVNAKKAVAAAGEKAVSAVEEDENLPVHYAIKERRADYIHALIDAGTAVSSEDLIFTIESQIDGINPGKVVAAAGKNIRRVNRNLNVTLSQPLEIALTVGDVRWVEELFDKGILLTEVRYLNQSYIPQYIRSGDDAMIRLLGDHGEIYNGDHLLMALDLEERDMAIYMIERGLRTIDDELFASVVQFKDEQVVMAMIDKGLEEGIHFPIGPVLDAGMLDAVDRLFQSGSAVNSKLYDMALSEGNTELAIRFLDAGAVKADASLLYDALVRENVPLFRALIKNGADVNQVREKSLLQMAVSSGNSRMALTLIEEGADVNEEGAFIDDENISMMSLAAAFSTPEVINALYNNGAELDQSLTNREGWAPIAYAMKFGRTDNVKALINLGAALNDKYAEHDAAYAAATFARDSEVIDILAKSGCDFRHKREDLTLTMVAVLSGRPGDVVGAIAKYDHSTGTRDDEGRTALALAAAYSTDDVVNALLAAGEDPMSVDNDGYTVFDRARMNRSLYGTDAYKTIMAEYRK